MWSAIWAVECTLSGQRAAHLITSPRDVLWDFSPEDQCTVLVIAHA